MIHNTYRRLDESSLQLGPLTLLQWLVLLAIGGAVVGIQQLTGMPTQAALCLATVTMGGPGAAMILSEGGRPSYLRLMRDAIVWAFSPKVYAAGGGTPRPCTLKLPQQQQKNKKKKNAPAELPAHTGQKELTA